MDKQHKKRNVPSSLEKILVADVYLTDQLVKSLEKILIFRQLRTHYKLLEISGHNLLWLPCWIAFIWVLNKKNLFQMQVNFLIGLLLDVLLVAVLKAISRRRRPAPKNDDASETAPDKFSFPSGHASRALYVASFFMYNWPVHFIFVPPLLAWITSVCLSKILMRQQHILDVLAGAILGIIISLFIGLIYLEKDTCTNLVLWITDEKSDGGEYHV